MSANAASESSALTETAPGRAGGRAAGAGLSAPWAPSCLPSGRVAQVSQPPKTLVTRYRLVVVLPCAL